MIPTDNSFINFIYRITPDIYWIHPTLDMANRIKCIGNTISLDVGFDKGDSTIFLALITKSQKVFCIDVVNTYMDMVKGNGKKFCPESSIIPLGSTAEHLPFKESLFDILFCRSVLQYTPMDASIHEMIRVLKPGGHLYIIANLDANPFIKIYRSLFRRSDRRMNFQPQGYLTFKKLKKYGFSKLISWHKEYPLVTPLLYPLLQPFKKQEIVLRILTIFNQLENMVLYIFPFLKKFCWYSLIEMKK